MLSKNPMDLPGRELVDPWISRLFFGFIDPVVLLANKFSHLKADQLPALLDADCAYYVTKKAFPVLIHSHLFLLYALDQISLQHLDPFITGKRQHILWGLLWFFREAGVYSVVERQ